MQDIEKELKSAQHLLYVSMKYTKTCDVIINLMFRWQQLISISINKILEYAKKKRMISKIPATPVEKLDAVRELFKREEIIQRTLDLYEFFRRLPKLEQIREHEFRKNVALKVIDKEQVIEINMDMLKSWNMLIDDFIKFTRHLIG
jgi:hypothetical protein